ncbi:serine/threonine protein kinase [Roseimaritima sediminicola]|uniref:serine/threonine protein kinase n=1 Tax=Roseimaritima sediminicola TaxID=2662066 RepID=UPI0012982593|nr:serine/threonine-protein kinase [Roseimaritima sediminicola]
MIATTTQCLTAAQMQALVDGRLSPDQSDSLIQHVDSCHECRERIEGLDSENVASTSWSLPAEPSLAVDSECELAIGNLVRQSPPADRIGPLEESMQLGPYKLLGTLGQGGMAAVCLAMHQRLNRKCAIKFLPRHRASDADWLRRFDREMVTVAALEHPHIVRATDAGHENGWHFLVMEYLQGMDVGRVASTLSQLPVADACGIVHQAALGLAYVHQHDLIHRDIKPSNLMLCQGGTVKLLDLGLVLAGDDPLGSDDRLTTVGHLMGTMPYMPPEQLLDSRSVSQAADVYALGATLYRLLCGRTPHPAQRGLASQVLAITQQSPPPVDRLRGDCPEEVSTLVGEMLDHDAASRPTAAEVAERLKPFAADAKLKRLVRHAQHSEPAGENLEPPSWMPTPARAVAAPPERPRLRRWMLAGGLPLLVLLAGFVIKLQTEHGDVTIEGDDANAVVSVRDGETTVELSQAAGGQLGTSVAADNGADNRVYQGQPLSYWLDLLRREQDVEQFAEAMNAVEMLSRGTDQRVDAAEATLLKARELGGFVIGLSSDPSRAFMGDFRVLFRRYLPDPGLTLLITELHEGNHNSRLATLAVLVPAQTLFRSELTASTNRSGTETRDSQRLSASDKQQLQELLGGLEKTVQSLQDRPEDRVHTLAVEMAVSLAVHLASTHLGPDQIPDWTAAPIASRLQENQQRYNRSTEYKSPLAANRPSWLPTYDYLAFALRHQEEDRFRLDADFAIASAANHHFFQADRDMGELLKTVAAVYPEHERELAEQLLESLPAMHLYHEQFDVSLYHEQFDVSASDPRRLSSHTVYWMQAIERIVAERELTDRALTAMIHAKERLQKRDSGVAQELLAAIDQALYVLQQRSDGKPPTEQEGGEMKTDPSLSSSGSPYTASAPSDASPADNRVYQGQPLSYWLDLLRREQDVDRIADAMNAAEILSRGTDRRGDAARVTLMKARELGGYVIGSRGFGAGSSNQDPSGVFMGDFVETFPQYMPDPGLPLLVAELHEGNLNSRLAALFVLATEKGPYLGEQPGISRNEKQGRLHQHLAADQQLLQRLLTGLEKTVQSLEQRPADRIHTLAVDTAVSLAMQLASQHLGPDQTPDWIAAPIAQRLEDYQKRYRQWVDGTLTVIDGGQGMSNGVSRPVWLPNYDFLAYALANRTEDRFQLDADFVIASATHAAILQMDRSMNALLEQVAEAYPDHHLQLAEQLLGRITEMSFHGGPISGGGPYDPNATHWTLVPHVEYWQRAVERIVAQDELSDRAMPALLDWKGRLEGLEGGAPQALLETIKKAIPILKERWTEKHSQQGGPATTGGLF